MPLVYSEMPRTAKEVQKVQQNFANAITSNQIEAQYVATAMIGRLLALKMLAKKQEDEFFTSLNLPTGIDGLKQLQARLDELNKDVGFRAMMDTSFTDMQKKISETMSDISYAIAEDQLLNVLVDSDEFKSWIGDYTQHLLTGKRFLQRLNKALKEQEGIQDIHYFLKSSTRGIIGKIKYVGLNQDGTPKIIWKMKKDTNETLSLSHETLNRIKRVVNPKKSNKISPTNLGKAIAEILCSTITDPTLKDLITKELTEHSDRYDFRAQEVNIKGLLGELYSAVAFKKITGLDVMATGNVKGNLNRVISSSYKTKEIGIDLVVGSYGMQIKRYSFLDGDNKWVSFTGNQEAHKKLPAMLNDVPDTNLVESLQMFFATMEFNTPWSFDNNLSKATDRFWESLDVYTSEIYPVFTTAYTSQSYNGVTFNQMFAQYLDRFIRVDQNIDNIGDATFKRMMQAADGGISGNDKTLYVNTLFNISGRLIPSSVILDSIMEELEQQITQQQSSNYWSYYFKINQTEELGPDLAWAPTHQKSYLSMTELAQKFSVLYNIKFNLGDVLKNAIEKIN